MRRVFVIAASSVALAACSSFPDMSLPSFEMPSFNSAPPATTMQFESEPSGAEVKTSTGQACRTPCSLAMTASEFTATFSLNGYQSQAVQVRTVASTEGRDPLTGQVAPPRMQPNPVVAELTPAPVPRRVTPAPTATKPPPKKKPKPVAKPKPTTSEPMASTPAAPPPSSPWPAPQPQAQPQAPR